eukprot:TRINITY_DN508_c0_g2_i10.p4 TRINITY_DN508_c0_g2~~TRINITY_DN508_c0_g2_i10.p4  ORF type:complete len:118 (+),score=36.34 TRINITY_DN508_c0_g2_i10:731-1084(+)
MGEIKKEAIAKNIEKGVENEIKMEAIAKNIEKGVELKPTETVDKAAPKIEDVKLKTVDNKPHVKVKTVDRKPHLAAIEGEHQLKPSETVDKAAPAIDKEAKVEKSKHVDLLKEIKKE